MGSHHCPCSNTKTRRQPGSSTARPAPTDTALPTCRCRMCAPASARAIASSGSDCSNRTGMCSVSSSRNSACTIWPSRTRSPRTNAPKLEQYDGSLFVVLRTAQLSGAEGLELGETHVFVGPRCVISYAMGRSRPTWVFAPGARLFRTFADLGRAERAFQTARRLGRHYCRPDDDCRDLWNELRQDAGTALAPWLPDGHDPDRRRLRITFRRFQKFGVALTSTETRQVRVLTVRPRATTISARSTPF